MKKVLKIVGIVILLGVVILIVINAVKNYIMSNSSWLKDNYYEDFKTDSKLEKKYAGIGEFEVTEKEYKSDNKKISKIRIWYPSELEKNDKTYPMIMIVNASNTKSFNLQAAFKRLASWGFIVVGNDDTQTGNAESTNTTLEYMLNDSEIKTKIDKENIGIVGYSQGGAGALRMVTMLENGKYFKTIFTGSASYPVLSKNMGWEYDYKKINIPYFMTASTGKSDDTLVEDTTNQFGGVAPLSSLKEIYENMNNDVFKIRARVKNAEHQDMLTKTDGYMTAWMLYWLQNDEDAGKVFIGDDAEILNNSNWQDIEKNK